MTVLTRVDEPLPLYGPPGFPVSDYLERLTHSYMSQRSSRGRDYRYEVCRMNPIMFGLYYFRGTRHLRMRDRAGREIQSLATHHIEMASNAREWAVQDAGPKAIRHAYAWPRKGAKTTWTMIDIVWAMAFGHRKYIVVYSDTEGQAVQHFLDTIRLEFNDNDRLLRDFPELCAPMEVNGRAVLNRSSARLCANGALIQAKGFNSATLGAKFRERRPDALILDEIQPKEGNYSGPQVEKRLRDMRDAIFLCNDEAVVQITGTTVMSGCLMNQVIDRADWVKAENIRVHHTTGIVRNPATGEMESCWPDRWSLKYLLRERRRNPYGFSKNYDNSPINENGTYWKPDQFTYDPMTQWLTDRILVIDPAAKSGKKNDETAIGRIAYASSTRQVVVEDVVGLRLPPNQLRERAHATCRLHGIKLILVDVTNGGEHVVNTLKPLPPGVRVYPVHITGRSKVDRFAELHDWYLRRPTKVVHAKPIGILESMMCSYPHVTFDDQIDVVALGAQWFIDGREKVGK